MFPSTDVPHVSASFSPILTCVSVLEAVSLSADAAI